MTRFTMMLAGILFAALLLPQSASAAVALPGAGQVKSGAAGDSLVAQVQVRRCLRARRVCIRRYGFGTRRYRICLRRRNCGLVGYRCRRQRTRCSRRHPWGSPRWRRCVRRNGC